MTEIPDPIVDLTHNRAPIYVQLSTLFRRFIVTGQWPVDKRIPTHEDLAVQFDVNPATIRKAIAILEDEGLVRRFRRHGTFVTAKPSSAVWVELGTTWADALRAYDGLELEAIESAEVDAIPEPFHDGGKPAAGYRRARRLYRRGREPVALEELYIDRATLRRIGDTGLGREPALKLLDRHPDLRVGRVEETIRFGIADGDISSSLDVSLNAPVVIVHLSVYDEDARLMVESTAYLRGDLVRISESIEFSRRRRRGAPAP